MVPAADDNLRRGWVPYNVLGPAADGSSSRGLVARRGLVLWMKVIAAQVGNNPVPDFLSNCTDSAFLHSHPDVHATFQFRSGMRVERVVEGTTLGALGAVLAERYVGPRGLGPGRLAEVTPLTPANTCVFVESVNLF
ncbi:hypothetical protein IMZ48_08645 [Candidatus Bathyarchaeota archaeon]|nr:hypothetical protein [Candidatus Bathyarchaeota archaeon]